MTGWVAPTSGRLAGQTGRVASINAPVNRPEPPTAAASTRPRAVRELVGRLRGQVVAAALSPFSPDGRVVHGETFDAYVQALAHAGIGGLAIGAHTGRGVHLDPADLAKLVTASVEATSLPVVAGVSPAAADDPPDALLPLAAQLRDAGASALLVAPPRGATATQILSLHERLGTEIQLPLVAFVLYERASGCRYDQTTVERLAAQPWVAGVKLALLDDAIGCQDLIADLTRHAPDSLIITGEDRMFGPSLLWGADTALVGIGAALPDWTVEVLDAWRQRDYPRFVAASQRLDQFAAATFREPMEGYVQRMAWVAAWQEILPEHLAVDPYGPALDAGERTALVTELTRLSSGARVPT